MTTTIIRDDPQAIAKILKNLNVAQQTAIKNHVGEAANHAANYMRNIAHVVTGHNKKNIQIQTAGEDEANVIAKARYAGWENKRGWPHNFFDQGYNDTKEKFSGTVLMGDIIKIVREKKI